MKKNLLSFIKKINFIINDIIDTLQNMSIYQKKKSLETISFGLLVNSIYGLSSGVNIKDIFIFVVSFYAIIRPSKRR